MFRIRSRRSETNCSMVTPTVSKYYPQRNEEENDPHGLLTDKVRLPPPPSQAGR